MVGCAILHQNQLVLPNLGNQKELNLEEKKIFFLCLHRSYEFHNHKNIMTSLFIMNLTKLLKTSILWHSAFFIVQLSHPYPTTGKTIALTRRTFVSKVMSLLFNMLSRLVITFLPRSKCLVISRLQSPSAVILEPPKISM